MQVTIKPVTPTSNLSRAQVLAWAKPRTKRKRSKAIKRKANDPDHRLDRYSKTLEKELRQQLRRAARRGDASRAAWLQPALDLLGPVRTQILKHVVVTHAG